DGGPLGSVEGPQPDEMAGQSAGLVAGPGVERGDELRLLDQPVLQGEQAEEEIAGGGDGGPEALPFRRTGPTRSGPRVGTGGGGGGRGEIGVVVLPDEEPRDP